MTRLDRFAGLVAQSRFDVAEACLMIAQDAYPALDIEATIGQLDTMAATVRARLPVDAFAEQKLGALNAYFFGELGFHGDTDNYFDPRNSYLNQVIDRRAGIPITLSILYCHLGKLLGLALQGISFPGHFMVKLRLRAGQLVLDPFNAGAPQSLDGLRSRLSEVLPAAVRAAGPIDVEPYLQAASDREIVARVLRNLKTIYLKSNRLNELLAVMNRTLLVAPESAEDLRDRGLVYERLECFRPAVHDLENYLRRRPDAADGPDIRSRLVALKGAAARLN